MSKLAGQRRLSRWLSARRGTWDGAKWADFEDDLVVIEAKAGKQIPARLRGWWDKLESEARVLEKEPLLLLDLPDGSRLALVRAECVFVKTSTLCIDAASIGSPHDTGREESKA